MHMSRNLDLNRKKDKTEIFCVDSHHWGLIRKCVYVNW